MTQHRLTQAIEQVFPGRIDTTIEEWSTAHADLGWANLTGPTCRLLDWEDWGTCPRGTDPARLWAASLAIPALAEQIASTGRATSKTGRDASWPCSSPAESSRRRPTTTRYPDRRSTKRRASSKNSAGEVSSVRESHWATGRSSGGISVLGLALGEAGLSSGAGPMQGACDQRRGHDGGQQPERPARQMVP